jgi:ElaB/YqjD/DUF883 family membrane-anchored ribosome-binding protein
MLSNGRTNAVAESQQTPNGSNDAQKGEGQSGFDQDIAMLRDDMTKLADSVSQMVREQTGVAQDRLKGVANEAYATANEAAGIFSRAGSGLYQDAHGRMDTLAEELTQTIKKAPLTSLGIAAALGFLYGIIRR